MNDSSWMEYLFVYAGVLVGMAVVAVVLIKQHDLRCLRTASVEMPMTIYCHGIKHRIIETAEWSRYSTVN